MASEPNLHENGGLPALARHELQTLPGPQTTSLMKYRSGSAAAALQTVLWNTASFVESEKADIIALPF